jgi:DNA polymerase I-like protein with 3'-5' exonuclease and polymerase domains
MIQKIPLRSLIRAPKGYTLIQCDLSAAEAWVVAFRAHDDNMKKGLLSDLHTQTARVIFEIPDEIVVRKDGTERYVGKRINHASNYRMGVRRFVQVVNKDSDKPPYVTITERQAKVYAERWHGYYNVKRWWEDIENKLRHDRTLTTIYGRRRVFYSHWSDDLLKEATAFEPQSTIADHMLGAVQPEVGVTGGLLKVYHTIIKPSKGSIKLINTSHDSGLLECPNALVNEVAEQFVDCLYRPMIIEGEELYVPVDCEVGEVWGELHKHKVPLHKKQYEFAI